MSVHLILADMAILSLWGSGKSDGVGLTSSANQRRPPTLNLRRNYDADEMAKTQIEAPQRRKNTVDRFSAIYGATAAA